MTAHKAAEDMREAAAKRLITMRAPYVGRTSDVIRAIEAAFTDAIAAVCALPIPQDAQPWISVEDRLPNDWGSTLIWSTGRDGGTDVAWFQLKDGGRDGLKAGKWYDEGEFEVWGVTHWMPLPAPPALKGAPTGDES